MGRHIVKDSIRINFTGPYSRDTVLENCLEHFESYVCSQCQTEGMSIIISDVPQQKVKHVGLKCETCDFSESAGEIDISHTAASFLYVRKWIKPPSKNAIDESEDRWDRI